MHPVESFFSLLKRERIRRLDFPLHPNYSNGHFGSTREVAAALHQDRSRCLLLATKLPDRKKVSKLKFLPVGRTMWRLGSLSFEAKS